MPVRVFIGPTGSGKTCRVLGIFKQFTPSEHCDSVRLIVPTISQVIQIRRLLISAPEFPGFLGDPVTTLYEFARDFVNRSGFIHPKSVTEIQRLGILKKIIAEAPPNYFDRIRDCPNFPDALGGIISSLKTSAITPEALQEAAESDENSTSKIPDLAALYQAYENELAAKSTHDRDDVIRRALEIARTNPGLLREYKYIIFDGFPTFTPVQQELIRLFAEHSGEVIISLDYEESRPEVYSSIASTMQFLRELPGASVEQISREQKGSALAHLKRQLFRPEAPKAAPDESINILTASTPAGEIELAADEIKKLGREQGFQYADFAVVSRSIGPYRQRIQSTFRQYGIPLETYSYPLSESRLAREILQYLSEKSVEKIISGYQWPEDEQALRESYAAWKAIRGIMSEIAAAGNEISSRTFADLLESAIRTRQYRVPGSTDGIALLDINMLRGRKFKAIFIVGMLDRTFPRHVREDSFLNDSERRTLNTHLPHMLRLREQDKDYEGYLFYMAVASAQDYLYLCYPLSDSPSCYLREADRLFTQDIGRIIHDTVPPIEQAETAESLLTSTLLDCCNSRDEERQAVAAAAYNLLLEKGRLSGEIFEWLGQVETPESDEPVEVIE